MKHTIRFVLACRFCYHHKPKIEFWRWECPFKEVIFQMKRTVN